MTWGVKPEKAKSHMPLQINDAGLSLIKKFEKLRLDTERGDEGYLVIGYRHSGKDVRTGLHITEGEADRLLNADLSWIEDSILRRIELSLTENEFSALVSLVHDVGVRRFADSSLRKKLNNGDRSGAAEAFVWFDESPQSPTAFTDRREAEKMLFLTPDH